MSGRVQRVPEGWGSQIPWQSAHEGCKIVSPTHGRLYLPPKNIPGTHFWYRLSRHRGDSAAGRITSMKISTDTIGNRNWDHRFVAQCLDQLRHGMSPIIHWIRGWPGPSDGLQVWRWEKQLWPLKGFEPRTFRFVAYPLFRIRRQGFPYNYVLQRNTRVIRGSYRKSWATFLHANWEQQTKESAVVDGTNCCVILECLVMLIACIT